MPLICGVAQYLIGRPESPEGHNHLQDDALRNVTVHMVTKFVGEHGFDLVMRVVLEQRVRQDNAARVSQTCKRGVGFLALLRQLPFVDSAHTSSRTLTQLD